MSDPHKPDLQEELEQFRLEKEKIRDIVGQIGGARSRRREAIFNIAFIVLVVVLFCLDVSRELLHIEIPLPHLFSLELGILLVSIKIIWMIHSQSRIEHFQFWILNSIEYRLNDVAKQLRHLEKTVEKYHVNENDSGREDEAMD